MLESVKVRDSGIDAASVTVFFVFLSLGVLVGAYPLGALALFGVLAVLGLGMLVLVRSGLASLALWKALVLTALSGFMVLGYGFANLAFHIGGIPVILGHALMFPALGLAVLSSKRGATLAALREPAMLALLALLLMAIPHLAFDIPQHGLYAVRDASIFFEGIFMLSGLLWARDSRNTELLTKWLFFLFLANLTYSYTFQWQERLADWSPKSGVFLVVPVLGSYYQMSLYLVLGALFCLLLGSRVARCPSWVWTVLILAQLAELAIHQERSMYLGLAFVLVLLLMLGEVRNVAKLTLIVALGIIAIVFATGVLGIQISGRIGPVNLEFLEAHARSLLLQRGTPETQTLEDRADWYAQVWRRTASSATNLLVGQGFGEPLIDFVTDDPVNKDITIRQPHNTSLSVLARMGLLGLSVWLIFHLIVLKRFFSVYRRRSRLDRKAYELVMFLFFFYLLSMFFTHVQPALEFSFGAIPFYFMTGFALGFMRRQLRMTEQIRRNVPNNVVETSPA